MGYDLTCILREVDLLEHVQVVGVLREDLGYPFLPQSLFQHLWPSGWSPSAGILRWSLSFFGEILFIENLSLIALLSSYSWPPRAIGHIFLVFRSPASIYSVSYLLSYPQTCQLNTVETRLHPSSPLKKSITRNMEDQMAKFVFTMMSCPCVLFHFSNRDEGRPFLYSAQLTVWFMVELQ